MTVEDSGRRLVPLLRSGLERDKFSRADAVRHALCLTLAPLLVFGLALPPVLHGTSGWDAHAYWNVWRMPPYHVPPGKLDAFNYSPAFAQVLWPITQLPWHAFQLAWSAVLLVVLGWLVSPMGRWRLLVFAICLPVVVAGNIEVLLAAAAVLGMSRPFAWAFPLLTKVTPGVGPIWFAVRREWRALTMSLVATSMVCVVSFAASPHLWRDWVTFAFTAKTSGQSIYPPFLVRLPLALAVTAWSAHSNRRWAIPVSMVLASPMWGPNVLAILTAIPRIAAKTNGTSSAVA